MPTYDVLASFWRDWDDLARDEKQRSRRAVEKFVADLSAGSFRPGLRIKGLEVTDGIFEMTWAPDGRATFEFGDELHAGEPHIIWRRVGGHDIFVEP